MKLLTTFCLVDREHALSLQPVQLKFSHRLFISHSSYKEF